MAEINYSKEMCWKIVENRPIKVSIENAGRYYRIVVPAMKMKYETFEHLGCSNLDVVNYEYRVNQGYDIAHLNINHINDVSTSSYDYHNGECVLLASTKKDVDNWLEKHKEIVKK